MMQCRNLVSWVVGLDLINGGGKATKQKNEMNHSTPTGLEPTIFARQFIFFGRTGKQCVSHYATVPEL